MDERGSTAKEVLSGSSACPELDDVTEKLEDAAMLNAADKDGSAEVKFSEVESLIQKGLERGDFKILEKTVEVVRSFLARNNTQAQVGELMETKGFVPLLVKSLKAPSDWPSLQRNAAWICEIILKTGKNSHAVKLCSAGLTPLLIKLFASTDCGVLEQATKTLGLVADHPLCDIRIELLVSQIRENVFSALKTLLKSKKVSEQLLQNISRLTINILIGGSRDSVLAENGGLALKQGPGMPDPYIVKDALPVLSLLLDLKNSQIKQELLQCMCICIVTLESLTPFISCGLSAKLTRFLIDGETTQDLAQPAVTLGYIASKGPRDLLKFLKSLKGTDGLKNYWKCLRINVKTSDNYELNQALCDFINGIGNLVFNFNEDLSATTVVIDSGFAHALALTLKNDCPDFFQTLAINILGMLSTDLPDSRKPVFIEMNLLPLAIKRLGCAEQGVGDLTGACSVIAMLVHENPSLRNEALSLGIVPVLLDLLRKNITVVAVLHNIMRALECLLETQPRAPLAAFENVPESLKDFFHNICVTTDDLLVVAIGCVIQLAQYDGGIDLIFGTPRFVRKLIALLYSGMEEVQKTAVQLFLQLCQLGTSQHRKVLLDLGILEHFKDLVLAPLKETRKVGLECLLIFQNDELTSFQKLSIERLRPLVLREMTRKYKETLGPAGHVYHKMIA